MKTFKIRSNRAQKQGTTNSLFIKPDLNMSVTKSQFQRMLELAWL